MVRRGRGEYRYYSASITRWGDVDIYGHVNNVVYYQWFDSAVNAWLVERGLLDSERGERIGLVVESGCTYFAPLTFPGEIEVGIAVERIGTSSVTYRLGVFARHADEAAAQGHFTHVYVDRETRRPAPLADAWRATLSELS